MIVAVAAADGKIAIYFEEFECFEIYEADKSQRKIADLKVHNNTDIVKVLQDSNVDLVICGNLDFNAEAAFYGAGMEVIRDVQGYVRDVLNAWQMGYLESTSSVLCENAPFC